MLEHTILLKSSNFQTAQNWLENGFLQHGVFSFISIHDHYPDVPLTFSMLQLTLRDLCADVAAESFPLLPENQAVRPG